MLRSPGRGAEETRHEKVRVKGSSSCDWVSWRPSRLRGSGHWPGRYQVSGVLRISKDLELKDSWDSGARLSWYKVSESRGL